MGINKKDFNTMYKIRKIVAIFEYWVQIESTGPLKKEIKKRSFTGEAPDHQKIQSDTFFLEFPSCG
jgi:hypothetical protein